MEERNLLAAISHLSDDVLQQEIDRRQIRRYHRLLLGDQVNVC